MVIDDFNLERVAGVPAKTDSPPLINADAPLAGSTSGELLQAIGRRDAQVVQRNRTVEHSQLAQGNLLNVAWQPARAAKVEDALCFRA